MTEYRTSDLALCAYLHLEGYGFTRIDAIEPRTWDETNKRWKAGRAEMVFSDGDGLQDAVAEYHTGNATVEPREYQRKIGWIRGLLLGAVKVSRVR